MGYEYRDYMQNDRGGGGGSFMPGNPACRFLLIATVAVFVLQIFMTRPITHADQKEFLESIVETDELTEEEALYQLQQFEGRLMHVSIPEAWLSLDTDKVVPGGQVWRLLTCAFLHDRLSVWHIAVNMALLYWFGRRLENRLGSREFLLFYVLSAIFASVVFVGLQLWIGENVPAIGASGAVMAVLCVYAILHPYETINLFMFLPIQMRYLLLLYVVFDLHPVLLKLAGTPIYTGTAHAAHLGGLLFGFLYWKSGWRLEWLTQWISAGANVRRPSLNRIAKSGKSRGARPVDRKLDANVDEILQKISDHGEASLSDKERAVLNEASRQYRQRNGE